MMVGQHLQQDVGLQSRFGAAPQRSRAAASITVYHLGAQSSELAHRDDSLA